MTTASILPAILALSIPISQGAEAKVYKAYLHSDATPILLKHRFRKKYRHPSLDSTLTRSRVAGEARAILKCLRAGVNVPGIRMVDAVEDVLGIEWIEGDSVRSLLPGGAESEEVVEDNESESRVHGDSNRSEEYFEAESAQSRLATFGVSQEKLMELIGIEIAKMHHADVIHGDLTTSNMMLRRPPAANTSADAPTSAKLVLIDFGLSYQSSLIEDKAVDLYVLERAFSSTHPESEPLFASVLKAYEIQTGKGWPPIARRLADVRLRGRKRSMVG